MFYGNPWVFTMFHSEAVRLGVRLQPLCRVACRGKASARFSFAYPSKSINLKTYQA